MGYCMLLGMCMNANHNSEEDNGLNELNGFEGEGRTTD